MAPLITSDDYTKNSLLSPQSKMGAFVLPDSSPQFNNHSPLIRRCNLSTVQPQVSTPLHLPDQPGKRRIHLASSVLQTQRPLADSFEQAISPKTEDSISFGEKKMLEYFERQTKAIERLAKRVTKQIRHERQELHKEQMSFENKSQTSESYTDRSGNQHIENKNSAEILPALDNRQKNSGEEYVSKKRSSILKTDGLKDGSSIDGSLHKRSSLQITIKDSPETPTQSSTIPKSLFAPQKDRNDKCNTDRGADTQRDQLPVWRSEFDTLNCLSPTRHIATEGDDVITESFPSKRPSILRNSLRITSHSGLDNHLSAIQAAVFSMERGKRDSKVTFVDEDFEQKESQDSLEDGKGSSRGLSLKNASIALDDLKITKPLDSSRRDSTRKKRHVRTKKVGSGAESSREIGLSTRVVDEGEKRLSKGSFQGKNQYKIV